MISARLTKILLGAALGVLSLGAIYLYAVRGQAIMLDLSGLARSVFCL